MNATEALAEVERLDPIATKEPWSLPIRDASVSAEQHAINVELTEVFRTAAPILARRVRELEAALSTLTRCAECGMCAANADCKALKEAKGDGR